MFCPDYGTEKTRLFALGKVGIPRFKSDIYHQVFVLFPTKARKITAP